jgi:hypothetical protein
MKKMRRLCACQGGILIVECGGGGQNKDSLPGAPSTTGNEFLDNELSSGFLRSRLWLSSHEKYIIIMHVMSYWTRDEGAAYIQRVLDHI